MRVLKGQDGTVLKTMLVGKLTMWVSPLHLCEMSRDALHPSLKRQFEGGLRITTEGWHRNPSHCSGQQFKIGFFYSLPAGCCGSLCHYDQYLQNLEQARQNLPWQTKAGVSLPGNIYTYLFRHLSATGLWMSVEGSYNTNQVLQPSCVWRYNLVWQQVPFIAPMSPFLYCSYILLSFPPCVVLGKPRESKPNQQHSLKCLGGEKTP